MDVTETKLFGTAIIVSIYVLAIKQPRLAKENLILGLLYFITCGRLGYDTLCYKWIIEDHGMTRFGWFWEKFDLLYEVTGVWWATHLIVYVFLVTAFFRLAQKSSYPALAFAMMVTLPGVGFSHLSIMRQALATGLLIHGCLDVHQKSWFRGVSFLVFAILAHSTSFPWIFAFTVYTLLSVKRNSTANWVFAGLGFIVSCLVALDQDMLEKLKFQKLIELYIEQTTDAESGKFLAAFWAAIGIVSLLLKAFDKNKKGDFSQTLRTIVVIAMYVTAYLYVGDGVRLIWYLLPLLIVDLVGPLRPTFKKDAENYTRLGIATIILLLAFYPIINAPDYYWQNQYPEGWYYAVDL